MAANLDFRLAEREDVPTIIALLVDDALGSRREGDQIGPYLEAFDRMLDEATNHLIVGEQAGQVIATYQITFISGLSLRAARRAQIESVRVASDLRGQGIGKQLMQDAEARARRAGCSLIQFTTNATRDRARTFYEACGFTPSHIGFKRPLV